MKVIGDLDKRGLAGKSFQRRFKRHLDARKWKENIDSSFEFHCRDKKKNGTVVV